MILRNVHVALLIATLLMILDTISPFISDSRFKKCRGPFVLVRLSLIFTQGYVNYILADKVK
jgi:hypothetical protein